MDTFKVTYIRKKGIRSINLRVPNEQEAVVSYPWYISKSEAEKFVASKTKWIEKQLVQMRIRKRTSLIHPEHPFKTKYHEVILHSNDSNTSKFDLKEHFLFAYYPNEGGFEEESFQEQLKEILVELMRKEAKYYLPIRLNELAIEHDFSYQSVSIRNAKTRWGSCSFKNSISLNLQLMKVPDKLIDYVILHELCHTKVKNHSRAFWELLESVCPNSKKLDKRLKNYSTHL